MECTVKVAVFNDGFTTVWGVEYFENLLLWETNNHNIPFTWAVAGTTYKFEVVRITDKQIFNGELDSFDVILFGAVDQYNKLGLWKYINPDKYQSWGEKLRAFIQNGGGYVGHCGGANLMCGLHNQPKTFIEHMINKCDYGIVDTKVVQHGSIPVLDQLHPQGSPKDIGETAYLLYEGMNPDSSLPQCGGVPMEFIVSDTTHPILQGFKEKTIRIRWGGGPWLKPGRKAQKVLTYPTQELSDAHPLEMWRYVGTGHGGYIGKLRGIIKSIRKELFPFIKDKEIRKILVQSLKQLSTGDINEQTFFETLSQNIADEDLLDDLIKKLSDGLWKAADWEPTGEYFQTDFSNKAALVTEQYGKGRIVLAGPHPEDPSWEGGELKNVDNYKKNNLWDGLIKWTDECHHKENPQAWLLRREVAWAAGLNENKLPPIPEYKQKLTPPPPKPIKPPESIIERIITFFRKLFGK